MTKLLEIYKCEICGNIVEVVNKAGGQLVCCGGPMTLQTEKDPALEGKEKHVPVIEKRDSGFLVKVGDVAHPMEEKHYIQWIELIAGDKVYREFLHPNQKPEVFFEIDTDQVSAREYCTLHGLWKK